MKNMLRQSYKINIILAKQQKFIYKANIHFFKLLTPWIKLEMMYLFQHTQLSLRILHF